MKFRAILVGLCLSTASGGAKAADDACDWSNFIDGLNGLSLGVVSDEKAHFVSGESKRNSSCPSADKACRLKSFVVQGDELLVAPSQDDYLCAAYKSDKGTETAGWLPKTAVALSADRSGASDEWAGEWRRDEEASIKIVSRGGGALEISGEATWGAGDPDRVRRGGVHVGELGGSGVVKNGIVGVGENYDGAQPPAADADDCQARLRLLGRYLVVDDNLLCGGVNVTFKGVYLRRGKN